MNEKGQGNLGVSIILFLFAIILLIFSLKQQTESAKNQEELTQQVSKEVSEKVSKEVSEKVNDILKEQEKEARIAEFPEYELYNSLEKKIVLLKDNQSYVTKNYKKIGMSSKWFSIEGKFRMAYVFINVSVDNGLPLTTSDSIYMLLNNKGGHILRNRSLPVPTFNTTHLLYDMREIPYINNVPYLETKQPLFADWLSEFNSKKEISLYTFLSSWREGGLINEITIAYECEQDSDCNILPK